MWSNLQTLAVAFTPYSNWSDRTMCQTQKTVQIVKPSPPMSHTNDCTAALGRNWKSNLCSKPTLWALLKSNTSNFYLCNSTGKRSSICLPAMRGCALRWCDVTCERDKESPKSKSVLPWCSWNFCKETFAS